MPARYALYYAPESGSTLERLGNAWLGRDLLGRPCPQPPVPDLNSERVAVLTAAPRHYGFHATLKPPFALAEGLEVDAFLEAVAAFAATRRAFDAPPLEVSWLGHFLALVPSAPCTDLDALAADCVRAFDRFRRPPSPDDLHRRRQAGLTPYQNQLLETWGYPYVMEEFRFHMTLTGRVEDDREGTLLRLFLADYMEPATRDPLPVRAVAVYAQETRESPFLLLRTFPFGE